MSNPDLDPQIQALFQQSVGSPPVQNDFLTRLEATIGARRRRMLLVAGAFLLALVAVLLVFAEPLRLAVEPVQVLLDTPLVSMPDNAAAWLLSPVNNLAVLGLALLRLLRFAWRKSSGIGMAS